MLCLLLKLNILMYKMLTCIPAPDFLSIFNNILTTAHLHGYLRTKPNLQ